MPPPVTGVRTYSKRQYETDEEKKKRFRLRKPLPKIRDEDVYALLENSLDDDFIQGPLPTTKKKKTLQKIENSKYSASMLERNKKTSTTSYGKNRKTSLYACSPQFREGDPFEKLLPRQITRKKLSRLKSDVGILSDTDTSNSFGPVDEMFPGIDPAEIESPVFVVESKFTLGKKDPCAISENNSQCNKENARISPYKHPSKKCTSPASSYISPQTSIKRSICHESPLFQKLLSVNDNIITSTPLVLANKTNNQQNQRYNEDELGVSPVPKNMSDFIDTISDTSSTNRSPNKSIFNNISSQQLMNSFDLSKRCKIKSRRRAVVMPKYNNSTNDLFASSNNLSTASFDNSRISERHNLSQREIRVLKKKQFRANISNSNCKSHSIKSGKYKTFNRSSINFNASKLRNRSRSYHLSKSFKKNISVKIKSIKAGDESSDSWYDADSECVNNIKSKSCRTHNQGDSIITYSSTKADFSRFDDSKSKPNKLETFVPKMDLDQDNQTKCLSKTQNDILSLTNEYSTNDDKFDINVVAKRGPSKGFKRLTNVFECNRELRNNYPNSALNSSLPAKELQYQFLTSSLARLSLQRQSIMNVRPEPEIQCIPEYLLDPRQHVLSLCAQNRVLDICECFTTKLLENCVKIGEGVYGEVFMSKGDNDSMESARVFKIMPIEGDQEINGEIQKKFHEIISEIVISVELSKLGSNSEDTNYCVNFVNVINCWCLQGKYPDKLLALWDKYHKEKVSENDRPSLFGEEQLYIVLEFGHGGRDLESFIFNNAEQSLAIFLQIAFGLAVAEKKLEFEHRDLHWGNVLIAETKQSQLQYNLNGVTYTLPTKGVTATIIDFTLSRLDAPHCVVFNNLGLDPALFQSEGDYQFDIYRFMKQETNNEWENFCPKTNIFWLHYILDKMINECYYKKTTTKVHKTNLAKLKKYKKNMLDFDCCEFFLLWEKGVDLVEKE